MVVVDVQVGEEGFKTQRRNLRSAARWAEIISDSDVTVPRKSAFIGASAPLSSRDVSNRYYPGVCPNRVD